ncbi:M23 family metallopeptidase [Patescibacteria group bacterium]|nr:M23 family metallopeptidase [Patescibacteria group bacterium]
MFKITLNLPRMKKLELSLGKRRAVRGDRPFFPNMEDLLRIKKGSRVSRFFKHVFEHKNIKRLLGANMAFVLIASSFVPASTSAVEPEQYLVSANNIVVKTDRVIRYPVDKIAVTQGYSLFHPGIDLDGITGDIVYPIMDGTVVGVSNSKFAYGNAILVTHTNDVTSLYAHLSKIYVNVGQAVSTDTKIGEMGATGRAFGDHLHLEVRKGGKSVSPLTVLPR